MNVFELFGKIGINNKPANKAKRITISSVNNGKDYLDRADLILEYGIRMETVVFDEIDDPVKLKKAGEEQLASQKAVSYQYNVSAVNLSHINPNFDEFEEGDTYPVINPVMNIDERLRVVARQIDLLNIERSSLTIGEKFKSAEEWQLDNIRKRTRQLVTINQLKKQQARLEEVRVIANAAAETVETVNNIVNEQSSQLLSTQDKKKLDYLLISKKVDLDDLLKRIENLERKV
ncbi:TPA: phage tail protein [Streptococcus pneumoniae]